ncbi:MAG TPA: class I SAM-dependent methyltransferase [Terriglobales bacterium]
MTSLHLQPAASPFDAIAAGYDDVFTGSLIGHAQRSATWKELAKAFPPGNQVLEIGCGTGVDACFLAENGVSVLGFDSSPEMIRVAQQRVQDRAGSFQNASVELCAWSAERLSSLHPARTFDGAFSNFGAINCIADLSKFAGDLASRLRPSAKLLLCVMGPCCLWEVAWYLARGEAGRAFRRFRHGGITATVASGTPFRVHYPTAASLAETFAPEFRLRRMTGIGLLVPPSYTESAMSRFPGFVHLAERVDGVLARCPGIRTLADHILLTFERVAR